VTYPQTCAYVLYASTSAPVAVRRSPEPVLNPVQEAQHPGNPTGGVGSNSGSMIAEEVAVSERMSALTAAIDGI
jgi:hypothetical protein